jgi:hypothetical protein
MIAPVCFGADSDSSQVAPQTSEAERLYKPSESPTDKGLILQSEHLIKISSTVIP